MKSIEFNIFQLLPAATNAKQLDLFSSSTSQSSVDMPRKLGASTAIQTRPIIVGGIPSGITADLPTLVVDGIKNTVKELTWT